MFLHVYEEGRWYSLQNFVDEVDDRFLRSPPHSNQIDGKKASSEFENLIEQLFHSPSLDMRLAIANSALVTAFCAPLPPLRYLFPRIMVTSPLFASSPPHKTIQRYVLPSSRTNFEVNKRKYLNKEKISRRNDKLSL